MLRSSAKTAILICLLSSFINCMYLHGQKEAINLNIVQSKNAAFTGFLGINAFEWDILDKTGANADEAKVNNVRSFGGFRHYMDWEKIENEKGKYTFNPTH